MQKTEEKIVTFQKSSDELLNYAFKKLEKNQYVNALAILRNALQHDPKNGDILLEMANIYTHMGEYADANLCAYYANALEASDEALYLLGTNYLKCYQYENGRRFLEKLIVQFPGSEFANYADEVLENMEDDHVVTDEMRLLKLSEKGKRFIEDGKYKKAIRLYTMLNRIDGDAAYIKNNLALSYFYDKQSKKAIELCKEILSKNGYDVYANCNLTLFYYKTKQKGPLTVQLKRLERLDPTFSEEYMKLVATYCEMGEHEQVIRYLNKMLGVTPMDKKCMYLLAAAHYNLGQRSKALSILTEMLKLDEHNYIAYYYAKMVTAQNPLLRMDYYMQIPFLAILDSIKRIKELVLLRREDLKKRWSKENKLITVWGLSYGDNSLKRLCINILGNIGGLECEKILKKYLFCLDERDELKKEAFSALRFMGAKQPYAAFYCGNVVEVNVSVVDNRLSRLGNRDKMVLGLIKRHMAERYDDKVLSNAMDFWMNFLTIDELTGKKHAGAIAACVEYFTCAANQIKVTKGELAKRYGASVSTINRYLDAFDTIMEQKLKEAEAEKAQNQPEE